MTTGVATHTKERKNRQEERSIINIAEHAYKQEDIT